MKLCSDCNVEMIENCIIEGQHPFELGADGTTKISIHIPTGEKMNFLGLKFDSVRKIPLKARFCPKCGKIEIYADVKI